MTDFIFNIFSRLVACYPTCPHYGQNSPSVEKTILMQHQRAQLYTVYFLRIYIGDSSTRERYHASEYTSESLWDGCRCL